MRKMVHRVSIGTGRGGSFRFNLASRERTGPIDKPYWHRQRRLGSYAAAFGSWRVTSQHFRQRYPRSPNL